ncbi:hypothetical protein WL27_15480 [Burkholderia multivorans]|nr:hypothetical protein WL27_15480 [Burkholderia multivorans]
MPFLLAGSRARARRAGRASRRAASACSRGGTPRRAGTRHAVRQPQATRAAARERAWRAP